MEKLFRVFSVINGILYKKKSFDNVIFNWFIIERENFPFEFEEIIINYNNLTKESKKVAEDYVREQFTKEEAELLKDMLDKKSSGLTRIEEIKLPVVDNLIGYNSLKIEKGKGFSDLYKKDSYKLPFKVKGFFNIDESDEKIIGDDNPTVITRIAKDFFENRE